MAVKTILIVDDSRIARMVVRGIVEKLRPDLNILEAPNGEEAGQIIQDHTVDAILLDHSMPGEPGLDLAARLKEQNDDVVIYMLTANIQDAMKARAKSLGIGFIEKPPTEEKIQAFLKGGGL